MSVYETILKLSKDKGLSQSVLERELGFGRSTISKWKRGTVPSFDKLQRLADYFGVTLAYLTGREELVPQKSDDWLKAELFGLPPEMVSDDMLNKIKQLAQRTVIQGKAQDGRPQPLKDPSCPYTLDPGRLPADETAAACIEMRQAKLLNAVSDFSQTEFDYLLDLVQLIQRYRR